MESTLANWISAYGYVLLFFLVGLESTGVPMPGETALLTAGAFAATGHLSIYWVIATAAAGAILGDNTGYWIGRKGGTALIHRYGHWLRLDRAKLGNARDFFDRHGPKAVFLGRFITILRTWTAMLAGTIEMRYRTFTLYNAAGGVVWAVLFGTLGYVFGRNLPRLEHFLGDVGWAILIVLGGGLGLYLLGRWLCKKCLS